MDLSDLLAPQAASSDARALLQAFDEQVLDAARRPLRMRLGGREGPLDRVLLLQSIDIRERLNHGIEGHLTCVSTRCDLPLEAFEGVPVEVGLVTDRGDLRPIRALVGQARRGQSDGALTLYQLGLTDPLALLDKRIATRLFNDRSVVEVSDALLEAALAECPAFGSVFAWRWLVDEARHPRRAFWMQKSESVGAYLRRQWARCGISWFLRPMVGRDGGDSERRIELVLFDDPPRLDAAEPEELRFHRLDSTEPADTVVLWSSVRRLASGAVGRKSWDYKAARLDRATETGRADHGASGNPIAAWLADTRIELPHAGNDLRDFERLTGLRMARHDFEAGCSQGIGGVRSLAVGASRCIAGIPELDGKTTEERTFTFIEVHHRGENNLKLVGEHAARLLDASGRLDGWVPAAAFGDETGAGHGQRPAQRQRYLNRFVALRRGTPLVARWDPAEDLPRTPSMTAVVAGPEGESVHTDELGRVRVRFVGEDSGGISAWMRCNAVHAGAGEGLLLPLKCGMEVTVEWEAGDESRPVIARVHYNGANTPPRFDHAGGLPGNRHMAGLHLHEVGSQRYGELVFDMTSGQISVQLGSEHAYSRLGLGELRGKRRDGQAAPIGEGFYLRTDASGAIRTGQALLLSTFARLQGAGHQLDCEEFVGHLSAALAQADAQGRLAADNQADGTDTAAQQQLRDLVADWKKGSNTAPDAAGGGQPVMGLSAAAGIAAASPGSVTLSAGKNIDVVAAQHVQASAGKGYAVRAGEFVSLFAHRLGVKIVAAMGRLRLVALKGPVEIGASEQVHIYSSAGRLLLEAPDGITLRTKGAELTLKDGRIVIDGVGEFAVHAAKFAFGGPGDAAGPGNALAPKDVKYDQRVALHHMGSDEPMRRQRYRISTEDGATLEGVTDEHGLTERFSTDIAFGRYTIEPLYD